MLHPLLARRTVLSQKKRQRIRFIKDSYNNADENKNDKKDQNNKEKDTDIEKLEAKIKAIMQRLSPSIRKRLAKG